MDKFQILRDFANSNEKPDRTIYQYIKEVLDLNSAYAKQLKKKDEVIEKAVDYIHNNWDGSSYTDETLKNKVAELNITELLQILEDKEADINAGEV